MTEQDFLLVAKAIKDLPREKGGKGLKAWLAAAFAASLNTEGDFDNSAFLKACGIQEKP